MENWEVLSGIIYMRQYLKGMYMDVQNNIIVPCIHLIIVMTYAIAAYQNIYLEKSADLISLKKRECNKTAHAVIINFMSLFLHTQSVKIRFQQKPTYSGL